MVLDFTFAAVPCSESNSASTHRKITRTEVRHCRQWLAVPVTIEFRLEFGLRQLELEADFAQI